MGQITNRYGLRYRIPDYESKNMREHWIPLSHGLPQEEGSYFVTWDGVKKNWDGNKKRMARRVGIFMWREDDGWLPYDVDNEIWLEREG